MIGKNGSGTRSGLGSRIGISLAVMLTAACCKNVCAQTYQLEIPGDPAVRSQAEWTAQGIVVRDAAGKVTRYEPRPELDSDDGQHLAYYSRDARIYLRWPASGEGPMWTGTLTGDVITWKRSRMQSRRIGGPNGFNAGAGNGQGSGGLFRRGMTTSEFAAATSSRGTIWIAKVGDDGTLDLFESLDETWRHQPIRVKLPPGSPLAMVIDEADESPRIFAIDAEGRLVEIAGGEVRPITRRRDLVFPRSGHLAVGEIRGSVHLFASDIQGRIWRFNLEEESAVAIEAQAGLYHPGLPLTFVAERRQAELIAVDRGGRAIGYALDETDSRPYLIHSGLAPGSHVAAIYARSGRGERSLHLAAIDPRGHLHLWQDAAGILVDRTLPDLRFMPGAPVALQPYDDELRLGAVAHDGRWIEWKQDQDDASGWSRATITDSIATDSQLMFLDNAQVAFAVDRVGRIIAARRTDDRWLCSIWAPGASPPLQLERRALTPNPPLPAVTVHFENSHTEPLVLRIHDLETGGRPVELEIAPGDSKPLRVQRSPGATLEEVFVSQGPDGQLVYDERRIPVPPRGRYTVTVYANRQTSVYFDRTRNKGPIPDESRNSLVSLGVFVLPPGDLLDDGTHIDAYRESRYRGNPGAAALTAP